uniref:Uncharacterized protein n=1 Tax=Arundo donax TaxID=35708 RepID=A0A0A9C2L3_ARUDO
MKKCLLHTCVLVTCNRSKSQSCLRT